MLSRFHAALRKAHRISAVRSDAGAGVSAKSDLHRRLRPPYLPGISVAQPLVGDFRLPAVVDLLIENAELIANAVADGGNAECGHRFEIACRQTAESAI